MATFRKISSRLTGSVNASVVNAADLGALKSVFFSSDEDADFNGDGTVNAGDLGILKAQFFSAPG
jgi:hypothetical protein